MRKLTYELRCGALPVMAREGIVLRKVILSVGIVRQDCRHVRVLEVKLSELPVVVLARMWIEPCLDGLRALVELWFLKLMSLELTRIHN